MKILMCTDGSKYAERAIRFGALIAKATDAEVTVFSVEEKDVLPAYVVTGAVSLLQELGIAAKPKIGEGIPAEVIIEESFDYDLVVIGSHGKEGLIQYVSGSTCYKIIKHLHAPVLVVRSPRESLKKILICIGRTEYAFEVLRFGGSIAKNAGSEVTLLSVGEEIPEKVKHWLKSEAQRFGSDLEAVFAHLHRLDEETLEKAKKILGVEFNIEAEILLKEGSAGNEILSEIERGNYDLAVLGSHDERDIKKLLLGSVASKVITHAKIPVLIVRRKK